MRRWFWMATALSKREVASPAPEAVSSASIRVRAACGSEATSRSSFVTPPVPALTAESSTGRAAAVNVRKMTAYAGT